MLWITKSTVSKPGVSCLCWHPWNSKRQTSKTVSRKNQIQDLRGCTFSFASKGEGMLMAQIGKFDVCCPQIRVSGSHSRYWKCWARVTDVHCYIRIRLNSQTRTDQNLCEFPRNHLEIRTWESLWKALRSYVRGPTKRVNRTLQLGNSIASILENKGLTNSER